MPERDTEKTIGIPLRRGRLETDSEPAREPVAVINADTLSHWPSALGTEITVPLSDEAKRRLGVIADKRIAALFDDLFGAFGLIFGPSDRFSTIPLKWRDYWAMYIEETRMPMRNKDDAIVRLDEAITWLRGYAEGSGSAETYNLARE